MTVEDHRLAADDDISDVMTVEQRDERSGVRREVVRIYFLRCHARTSGEEGPWTLTLSS